MLKMIRRYTLAALAAFAGRGPLEAVFGQLQKGVRWISSPSSGNPGMFAGRTPLNSGTATVTVSTAMVNSDSIISFAFQVSTLASSGMVGTLGVSSIVHRTSFALGYVDGQGRAPGGTFMWEIKRTS